MGNHRIFSENMKLADLIHANYKLLFVFPRFDIELGFGESSVKQICEQKNISIPLFLLVCNVYTYEEYLPDNRLLDDIPLDNLVCYLKNSHKDYRINRIPRLSQNILDAIQEPHKAMFGKFCEKYENDVSTHLDYEEKVVFPYIISILQGNKVTDYRIEIFEEIHDNVLEESLNDLKNILIKYLPKNAISEDFQRILCDVFLLEDDLDKHTLLEERILISLVERIEKHIK
ncbi:MAG: hemerythrin domain-containing protein [Prevotellaceae bacterium]|jgi:regulator of cell morphogenesis and NO signaling|nr:hemerythrin domain-containing protein [Prevotellaceae bacterium]